MWPGAGGGDDDSHTLGLAEAQSDEIIDNRRPGSGGVSDFFFFLFLCLVLFFYL